MEPADPLDEREFLRRFEEADFPPGEFRHAHHLRVAWIYLRDHPLPEALALMRAGIERYAAARSLDELYHETVTFAFVLLVNERMEDCPERTWDAFRRDNPDLFEDGRGTLLRYYSPETLDSRRARKSFVLPDRLAVDGSRNR